MAIESISNGNAVALGGWHAVERLASAAEHMLRCTPKLEADVAPAGLHSIAALIVSQCVLIVAGGGAEAEAGSLQQPLGEQQTGESGALAATANAPPCLTALRERLQQLQGRQQPGEDDAAAAAAHEVTVVTATRTLSLQLHGRQQAEEPGAAAAAADTLLGLIATWCKRALLMTSVPLGE